MNSIIQKFCFMFKNLNSSYDRLHHLHHHPYYVKRICIGGWAFKGNVYNLKMMEEYLNEGLFSYGGIRYGANACGNVTQENLHHYIITEKGYKLLKDVEKAKSFLEQL